MLLALFKLRMTGPLEGTGRLGLRPVPMTVEMFPLFDPVVSGYSLGDSVHFLAWSDELPMVLGLMDTVAASECSGGGKTTFLPLMGSYRPVLFVPLGTSCAVGCGRGGACAEIWRTEARSALLR